MDILQIVLLVIIILQLILQNRKVNKMGLSLEKLQTMVDEIDVETTRIAELLNTQIQLLKDGTITVEELETNVRPVIATLQAMGQPIPPTP